MTCGDLTKALEFVERSLILLKTNTSNTLCKIINSFKIKTIKCVLNLEMEALRVKA